MSEKKLTPQEREQYYDKWRALKDDIEQTIESMQIDRHASQYGINIVRGILRRMDEFERGER